MANAVDMIPPPDLLSLAADFTWRSGPDFRIDEISPLDVGCDPAVIQMLRGAKLDRLAQRTLYPAQGEHLGQLLMRLAPMRDIALSFAPREGAVVNFTLTGTPAADGGYVGVGKVWSGRPFDEQHRGELVELLERAEANRNREMRLREEADVLLASLRALIQPSPLADKCAELFSLFARLLRFDEALVVRRRTRDELLVVVATDPALSGMKWPDGDIISAALMGEALVIADMATLKEWPQFPESLRRRFRNALVAPLTIGTEAAMLVALHRTPGFFEPAQLALMQRLSLIATQAFEVDEQKNILINTAKLATLGELMTVIAHEISQPLSVIAMAVKNAKLALESENERQNSVGSAEQAIVVSKLDRIHTQALRAGEIISAIRTLAHPDRRTLGLRPVSVTEIMDNIRHLTEGSLRNRGIQLICEAPPYCRPLKANPVSLQQVFLNLVVNARDAIAEYCSNRNEPTRGEIRITVHDDRISDRVLVEVQDTGGGIPGDVMNRIFDAFFTLKEVGHGSGLGLSICRTLMTDMGGTISASNVGDGAVFRLEIPAYVEDAASGS
ncbi:MAG: GAF domain-containing sensor histidine kinase [Zavarzinia sp.]|nr:GAF domain-containing sensor histidine kinase [Zavarzinia sp.]